MKALFFSVIVFVLALGALGGLIAMTFVSANNLDALGDVGAKAVAVQRANQQANALQLYVQRAATQATVQALLELSQATPVEQNALVTECGRDTLGSIPVWYNNGACAPTPQKILKALEQAIQKSLRENVKSRTSEGLVTTAYALTLVPEENQLRVIGVPERPSLFPLNSMGERNFKVIATVAAQTDFDIVVPYALRDVLRVAEDIDTLASCVETNDNACLHNINPHLFLRKDSTPTIKYVELQPAFNWTMPELTRLRPLRFAIVLPPPQ